MKITYEAIKSFSTLDNGIALNSYQLRLLGIGCPPKHGWVESLIGVEVSDELVCLLSRLKGPRKKRERNAILAQYGVSAQELFCTPLHSIIIRG